MDLHFTAMKLINDKTLIIINHRNYLSYLMVIFVNKKIYFSPILTFYRAIRNKIPRHILDTL